MPRSRLLPLLCFAVLGLACSDAAEPRAPAPRTPGPGTATPPPDDLQDAARAFAPEAARQPRETDWSGGDRTLGAALYADHCALCHGAEGAGDGPAAVSLHPKPRDFRTGRFYLDADADGETGTDIDLARVIREGPAAFGGSPAMIAWQETLRDDEIRHLVAFLRSLEPGGGR